MQVLAGFRPLGQGTGSCAHSRNGISDTVSAIEITDRHRSQGRIVFRSSGEFNVGCCSRQCIVSTLVRRQQKVPPRHYARQYFYRFQARLKTITGGVSLPSHA